MKKIFDSIRFRLWRLWSLLFRGFVLDIHLADHCNLNCKSCNHYSPLAEPAFRNLERLEEDLRILGRFRKSFRTVRLLGGEPLLNPQIAEAVDMVCRHMSGCDIEIVTNGILLAAESAVKDDFWDTCVRCGVTLAITEYPIAADYDRIRSLCKSRGVAVRIFENRSHGSSFNYYRLNPKGTESGWNYYKCVDNSCLQLCDGRIYTCAPSAYVGFLNKKTGSDFKIREKDWLDLKRIRSAFDIRLFLLRKKPFCSYCIFPRESFCWERSGKKASEWIKE